MLPHKLRINMSPLCLLFSVRDKVPHKLRFLPGPDANEVIDHKRYSKQKMREKKNIRKARAKVLYIQEILINAVELHIGSSIPHNHSNMGTVHHRRGQRMWAASSSSIQTFLRSKERLIAEDATKDRPRSGDDQKIRTFVKPTRRQA
jgi:hypothetical protein